MRVHARQERLADLSICRLRERNHTRVAPGNAMSPLDAQDALQQLVLVRDCCRSFRVRLLQLQGRLLVWGCPIEGRR